MPNQPKTPHRAVRVPDELWAAAKAATEARGETIAQVIRRALTDYVEASR